MLELDSAEKSLLGVQDCAQERADTNAQQVSHVEFLSELVPFRYCSAPMHYPEINEGKVCSASA